MENRKEYHQNYYKNNKERMRETLQIWKDNNKEHLKDYRREYYREYNRKKRLKKLLVEKTIVISMCLTEAYLEGNQEDIKTFKYILERAVKEALDNYTWKHPEASKILKRPVGEKPKDNI